MSRISKAESHDEGLAVAKQMTEALDILNKRAREAMKGKVLQMPLWPADLVGTPNVILRNALFRLMERSTSEGRKHKSMMAVQELIASASGDMESVQVWFTGLHLNQTDLDFYEAVLQLAGEPNTEIVEMDGGSRMLATTSYEILKRLNRQPNSRNYKLLEDSFLRLREGSVRIVIKRKGLPPRPGFEGRKALDIDVGGPLLLHGRDGHRHLVGINPLLTPLFTPGSYSLINLPMRLSLRKDLSKWLMAFFSTHARPLAYSLEKIRTLSGSSMKHTTRWRSMVVSALDELVSVGFLSSYEVDKFNNVHVKRALAHVTHKQAKFLEAKAQKPETDSRQQSLL